jgi:ribosomal protein S18 acetylase RimI-like enzyme
VEHCRAATPDDLGRIVELARELHGELAPMRGGRVWAAREARVEPLEPGFAVLLDDPDVCVLVGTIDEVIVGFGVVTLETLTTGERLGRIAELFVEEAARAVGVGEAICDRLVAFAMERHCVGVDAVALPGHRATKNFFEDQGFTARALVMHRPARPDEL